MKQLYKRYEKEQIKELLEKNEKSGVKREVMCEMLGIGRAQFFRLLKRYRQGQEKFTILYKRRTINQCLDDKIEELIVEQLKKQKEIIENPEIPVSKKAHDRVVYTQKAGQLIQRDSSHHLFAPFACKKWYLITSIVLLEARFIEAEALLSILNH